MKNRFEMLSDFGKTTRHDKHAAGEWPAAAAVVGRLIYATGYAGEGGWRCQVTGHRQYTGAGIGKDSVQVREVASTQRRVTLRVKAAENKMYFDLHLFFALHSQPPADVIKAIRSAADKVSGRLAVYADGPPPPPPSRPSSGWSRRRGCSPGPSRR